MELRDCKDLFKTKYSETDFELIDEHPTELFYKAPFGKIKVPESELESYINNQDSISNCAISDNGCSLISKDYREVMLKQLRPYGPPVGLWAAEDRPIVFGDPSDNEERYVEISPASELYISCVRFEAFFIEYMRFRRNPYRGDFGEVFDIMKRILTAKVFNIGKNDILEAERFSEKLIDSCLFELAYLSNLSLGIADEWPSLASRRNRRQFQIGERHQGRQYPYPRSTFQADLVRFYLMAMSTDVSALQFLSFYQILEYFFVTVSDELLYGKLRTRLIDPKFRATPKNLDKVILDVTNHKKINDETEMLKNVIGKFVDESEIIDFIQEYEKHLGDTLYTKRRKRFGIEAEVKLNTGHVIGNVAKVIKIVRNALVHSSDHYERTERHVPSSESTKIVEKEIPLLKFIAEKVIIGSTRQS